ncbi:MAG: hypothetical protein CMJ82_01390 [Planctomycetaceae bacterium]|nr:hypothetical protein [Planctomycetaceae bacterium]
MLRQPSNAPQNNLWLYAFAACFVWSFTSHALGQSTPIVFPNEVSLTGPESSQQFVVNQRLENGRTSDLTRVVEYSVSDTAIATVNSHGMLVPLQEGETQLLIRHGQWSQQIPIKIQGIESPTPVDFRGDIQPILTKAACNSGGCHGKAEGQNGFKLSVFAFDDTFDHDSITRHGRGRRINIAAPESSLLIRKATGLIPHGGGRKVSVNGLWYKQLTRWIKEGAAFDSESSQRTTRLDVYPKLMEVKPDSGLQLQVFAVDENGNRRCVTREAEFFSNAEAVARPDEDGWVHVDNVPGEAAILVRYRGQIETARIRLPQEFEVTPPKSNNEIDDHVWTRLSSLGIQPSHVADDAVFLRRVYLDTIGTLPTIEESRRFLTDPSADKRSTLIATLLERPEYADYWAMKWADILRVDREIIKSPGTIAMTRWLRSQLAANRPYDEFVSDIVTAQGNTNSESAAAMYLVHNDPEKLARSVSQVFLGVRIECAQCHQHPFERWGQEDYFAFAGFFSGVKNKKLPAAGTKIYDDAGADLKHPRTGESVPFAGLGSPAVQPPDSESPLQVSRRQALSEWIKDKDNPFLAPMIVNRLWAHYFGRGLVDPVDDIRETNPASNEPLMEYLTGYLKSNQFDLKKLTALMLNSTTYQLSSITNDSNIQDGQNFSHASWRSLPAEVLLDAISQVTGVPEDFNGWPSGYRAIEIWDNRMPNYFFRVFGKPQRVSVCECERGSEPSIAQALHLMNAPESIAKIRHRQGTARLLANSQSTDDEIIESLYLACFSRFPNADEMQLMRTAFSDPGVERKEAVEDIVWALLNSREFVFNH